MTILQRLGLSQKPVEVAARPAQSKQTPATATRHFFVRGHPRSGTNWLGALLNLHPRINCWGEFHFEDIRNAIDIQQGHPWQITAKEPLKTVVDDWFEELVRRSIKTLESRKPGADWIGDRTPRGLRIFLQGAPYFLIIRDGRDVLVSWTFHILRQRPHAIATLVPDECKPSFLPLYERFQADSAVFTREPHLLLSAEPWVRMVAARWSDWMKADLASLADIAAGKPKCDGKIMQIRYEDLHADVEGHRRKMYEHLGLNPAEAAPLSPETKTAAGFEQDDPTSFWRHGQIGDWKTYVTSEQARWITESMGEMLERLGYGRTDSIT